VSDDADVTQASVKTKGISVRSAMMPCSSKVQTSHLLKILDQEADGVEVVACPEGACRFLVGSKRTQKRVDYARKLLDEIQVGADRLGISRRTGLSGEELMKLATDRATAVQRLMNNGDDQ